MNQGEEWTMSTIEDVAERVRIILSFAGTIDEEGLQLLEKALEKTSSRISHNEAALPVIMALGGQYDGDEDELKSEEMRLIIELVKVRHKYRDHVIEKASGKSRNANLLNQLFGL